MHAQHRAVPSRVLLERVLANGSFARFVAVRKNDRTELSNVRDLTRSPELIRLNRFTWVPLLGCAVLCYAAAGLAGVVWGFVVSTVAYCSLKVPAFFGVSRHLRERPAWKLRSDRRVSRANVARLRAWSRRVQEDRA